MLGGRGGRIGISSGLGDASEDLFTQHIILALNIYL